MALSKIIAEGVDLTDDYAFTGTVTGAGEITASTTAPSEGGSATTNVVQGLSKWWVNVQQENSFVVHNSFNISSTSDDGTAKSTVTFVNNMDDNVYCAITGYKDGGGFNDLRGINQDASQAYSTSQFGFYAVNQSSAVDDAVRCWVSSLGDLA